MHEPCLTQYTEKQPRSNEKDLNQHRLDKCTQPLFSQELRIFLLLQSVDHKRPITYQNSMQYTQHARMHCKYLVHFSAHAFYHWDYSKHVYQAWNKACLIHSWQPRIVLISSLYFIGMMTICLIEFDSKFEFSTIISSIKCLFNFSVVREISSLRESKTLLLNSLSPAVACK